MKGILYQIFNHDTPEASGGEANLDEYVKFLEKISLVTGQRMIEVVPKMPFDERRFINTHMLPRCMPKQYSEKKPKTIYITRNPKDTVVSLWHFANKTAGGWLDVPESWEAHLENFLDGNIAYGSHVDHLISWWSLRNQLDIMFVTYEDLKEDLKGIVMKISTFLGETLTEEVAAVIAERCNFDRMKTISDKKNEYGVPGMMYRQGIVGGWKTQFTVAQSEHTDAVYKEKLKDLDLKYKYE
ncbi:sulfotransferase 1B1-like isoform X2 [Glandiceps talaboti]